MIITEELKAKIAAVQSKEEYMELLKEYQLTDEIDNGILSDEILANVSGGYKIDDVIYTAMRCENTKCGYSKRKKGFWVATIEKCPKCGQVTFHGKQLILPW